MNDDDLLVGDVERERAIEVLRHAAVDGRLTLDELSTRTEAALGARTRGDLAAVTKDLGDSLAMAPGLPATSWVFALLGRNRRDGRWRAEGQVEAVAVAGRCQVDLRDAEIVGSTLTLNVLALGGRVQILVPEGVPVVLDDVSILGSNRNLRPHRDPLPGAPVVRVQGVALLGSVEVLNEDVTPLDRLHDRYERRRERREERRRRRELR